MSPLTASAASARDSREEGDGSYEAFGVTDDSFLW